MVAKKYSDEQINEFHGQYLKLGTSMAVFARKNCLSVSALGNGFKRLNLEIIPQEITKRKFPINQTFFEVIDSEEKAYMLGFLYADGCNHEESHKIEISLAKQDEDILIKFSKLLLNGNVQILEYETDGQPRVGLYLINKKISDDLTKLGCVARKTFILTFPSIPKKLHSHFIRGYFDGDGMLTYQQRPNSNYKEYDFSVTSTIEFLNVIKGYLESLNVHVGLSKRHKDRDNNNFTIRIAGNQQIKRVCDFLYKDATIFLDRKHQKYLELIELSKKFRKKHKYE